MISRRAIDWLRRRALVGALLGLGCSATPLAGGAVPPLPAASADLAVARDLASPADLSTAAPPTALRVLFIGNSYTYVNNLPQQVHELARTAGAGPAIEVEMVAYAGLTLRAHWESGDAVPRIRARGWTHVVLQGQSLEPAANRIEFLDYARRFGALVVASGAKPIFFETWARRAGDPIYQELFSGRTPANLQALLRESYADAARSSGARVAPVGDAWERALAVAPPPPFFAEDGSHPTPLGSYLAGCVFYRSLTGRPSRGLAARPPGVSASVGLALQQIADDVNP